MDVELEFAAVVTDIREESRTGNRQRWQMTLDRTAFTTGDAGTIEATAPSGARLVVEVLRVAPDEEGELWHIVEKPLTTGTSVVGRVHRTKHKAIE